MFRCTQVHRRLSTRVYVSVLRMSVFRDDVVFIIMLYQRWLYRKKRTPENAEGQEMKKVN